MVLEVYSTLPALEKASSLLYEERDEVNLKTKDGSQWGWVRADRPQYYSASILLSHAILFKHFYCHA